MVSVTDACADPPRLRDARRDDVPSIARLLADDPLGATRESPGPPVAQSYYDAFAAIEADPNNELIVAEHAGALVGLLQITYLPGMSYAGGWRAQVEGVRVAAAMRGSGLGRTLLVYAIERARERGCRLIQLTSDKTRPEAIRFYRSLGFRASHEGMKLVLHPGHAARASQHESGPDQSG